MPTTKTARLSDAELDAWRGFRRMGELISSLVAQQITVATGLSGADFAVLAQLHAAGGGKHSSDGTRAGCRISLHAWSCAR